MPTSCSAPEISLLFHSISFLTFTAAKVSEKNLSHLALRISRIFQHRTDYWKIDEPLKSIDTFILAILHPFFKTEFLFTSQ